MSDEWNWNDGQSSSEENKNKKTVNEDGESICQNEPEESLQITGTNEEAVTAEPGVQEGSEPESKRNVQPDVQQISSDPSCETYHWVNPEYQRRQQRAADAGSNTYETNSYRENVGSTPNQGTGQDIYSAGNAGTGKNVYGTGNADAGQNSYDGETWYNNGQPGYRGGAYHSDWRNQSRGQASQSQSWSGQPQSASGQPNHNQTNPGGEPITGQRHYGTYQFAPEKPKKSPREKKPVGTGKKFLVTAGLAVVFGLVAGGVMFGVNSLGNHLTGQDAVSEKQVQIPSTETPVPTEVPSQEVSSSAATGEFTVSEVASACMPSVVSITNASVKSVQDFFGGVQEYPIKSSGSGIIVGQNDKELLIATNNHVVEGADTITVAFNDDAVYEAQLKGNAEDSDLAVIAVKLQDMTEETLNSIKVVTLGDSDSLKIGEQVVAIGNALGYGQSVTSGWVSAVNREVTDEEGNSTGALIQTDAAINPGNSGGALLNMRGELIGINSAKAAATEVEGMGYAIPIATAQPILDELMNRETRFKADEDKAAYIGVTCLNVDSSSAQMYGIPVGAFIDSVEEGGPAATAGIQKGDVIVKFDGLTISGSTELVNRLEYYEVGETVEVVISRAENGEYKEQTVTVTLGRRKDMKQADPQQNR